MTDQIKIMIQYKKVVADRSFADTIILTQAEYDAITPEQIEAIKQERVDAWLAVLAAADYASAMGTSEPPVEA
jgi:hypothetical protein